MSETNPLFSEPATGELPLNADQTGTVDSPPTPTPAVPSEFTYVRLSDGSIDKVRTSDIQHVTRNDAGQAVVTDELEEFYVHLSDGSVERVKADKVPVMAGTNAVNGHFERDGNVYLVTGVYPVESKVSK